MVTPGFGGPRAARAVELAFAADRRRRRLKRRVVMRTYEAACTCVYVSVRRAHGKLIRAAQFSGMVLILKRMDAADAMPNDQHELALREEIR